MKEKLWLLMAFFICLTSVRFLSANTCPADFTVKITTTPSTCQSNGTVTVTLEGDTTNLIVFYGLSNSTNKYKFANDFTINQQRNNVMSHIPPGKYLVSVRVSCSEDDKYDVIKYFEDVIVEGGYEIPVAFLDSEKSRKSFGNAGRTASTGIIVLNVTKGSGNYVFSIFSAPPGVPLGVVHPEKDGDLYTLPGEQYPFGDYVIHIDDGCYTRACHITLMPVIGCGTFKAETSQGFSPVLEDYNCNHVYWEAGYPSEANSTHLRNFEADLLEIAFVERDHEPTSWTPWTPSSLVDDKILLDISPHTYSSFYESRGSTIYIRRKGDDQVQFYCPTYLTDMPRPDIHIGSTITYCDTYSQKIGLYTDSRGLFCYPISIQISNAIDGTEVWSNNTLSYSPDSLIIPNLEYNKAYEIRVVDQNGTIVNKTIKQPRVAYKIQEFCSHYQLAYEPTGETLCSPVSVAILEQGVSICNQTLNNSSTLNSCALEYNNNYTVEVAYADAPANNYSFVLNHEANLPTSYTLELKSGDPGFINTGALSVNRDNGSLIPIGTTITITGPSGYVSQSTQVMSGEQECVFPTTFLPPGEYTATIDPGCGSSFTAPLDLKGVYDGTLVSITPEFPLVAPGNYTQKVVCKGTLTYNGENIKCYYRIVDGPAGYDKSVVSGTQGTYILTMSGVYTIGLIAVNDETARPLKTVTTTYIQVPFSLEAQKTCAFVCAENDNSVISLWCNPGLRTPYFYSLWNKDNTVELIPPCRSVQDYTFNYGEADSTYTVRVSDRDGNSFNQKVTVTDTRAGRLSFIERTVFKDGIYTVCPGDTFLLNSIHIQRYYIEWYDSRNWPTITNPNIIYYSAKPWNQGWYRTELNSPLCGSREDDFIRYDSVYLALADTLSSIIPNSIPSVCVGSTTELSTITEGGCGNYKYQWQTSPDGLTGWTNIADTDSTIYTPAIYHTAGNYYYRCETIDNCQTIYSDVITVRVDAIPTAEAGPDQAQHKNYTFTMDAEPPPLGTGSWSVYQGNVTIDAPTNPNTQVTLSETDNQATLVWTVTNGACAAADTVVLYTRNYWYGANNTDWNDPGNWTLGLVPNASGDVEFATALNNNASGGGNGLGEAVNDLVVSENNEFTIRNLINASSKNIVLSAGGSLTVSGVIQITDSESGLPSTNADRIQIKAEAGKPNGTLIVNCEKQRAASPDVYVTVDLHAKGFLGEEKSWEDNIAGSPTFGQSFKSSYHWQFIGVPVESIQADPTFYGAALREYFEDSNGGNISYYQKWKDLQNHSQLQAFKGYEITQTRPTTYSIKGKLVYCDATLTMTRRAPMVISAGGANAHYGLGQNIFGNSFTSSIDMEGIDFPAEAEQTIYLYNTGSFAHWGDVSTPPNDGTALTAGQYTAIPRNTGSSIYGGGIPSMNGFLVKFTEAETQYNQADANLILRYDQGGVKPNTHPQTVKKEPLSYMSIRLDSKSTVDNLWLFSQPGTSSGFDNGWDGKKTFGTPTAYIYKDTPAGLLQVCADKTLDGSLISFYANQDTEYTLTLSKSNLDSYDQLHLVDFVSGQIVPLDQDTTVYPFVATNNGYAEKRFQLINSASTHLGSDKFSQLDGYLLDAHQLYLTNYTDEEGHMRLYDMTGRVLITDVLLSGSYSRQVSLHEGVYILHLEAAEKKASIKLVIK